MIGPILDILTSQVVRVSGVSMTPTLPDGAWIIVKRSAFRRQRRPRRFDIVRFEDPAKPGRWLLKRVVGLPEEEVRLEDGQLFIDGLQVTEEYVCGADISGDKHEWWPRSDEYVLLGDNRSASTDSRKFGPVPVAAFRGKVSGRLR